MSYESYDYADSSTQFVSVRVNELRISFALTDDPPVCYIQTNYLYKTNYFLLIKFVQKDDIGLSVSSIK